MKNGTAFQEQWPLIKRYLLEQMELNEVIPSRHAESQMMKRSISMADIKEIVRFWSVDEMYDRYKYPYGETAFKNPNPVFSITGQDAYGRKLTIAFALKKQRRILWFGIVTTFLEDELRRNRHETYLDNDTL